MEQFQKPTHRQSTFQPGVGESAQLKSELILHKRKLKRLQEKEKRIQVPKELNLICRIFYFIFYRTFFETMI